MSKQDLEDNQHQPNLWHQNQVGVQIWYLGCLPCHVDAKYCNTVPPYSADIQVLYHDIDKMIFSGSVEPLERFLCDRINVLPKWPK